MKIGVVADTHSRAVPKKVMDAFKEVDMIVHAGDFCDLADFEAFAKIKETRAVHGNMDTPAICRKFPRKQIFECGECAIGLFHGEGAPNTLLEVVKNEFRKDKVDVVIFGHSHRAFNEKIGKVLYFNPGSPNDDIYAPFKSYGLLEIKAGKIFAKIIKLKE